MKLNLKQKGSDKMLLDFPFANHMVLQHHKEITITGTSSSSMIVIDFLQQSYQCPVKNQHWSINLYLQDIGGPYQMIFDENGKKTILDDIYIGDVYLAAGQSNMEMKIKQLPEYHHIHISNKIIRFLNVAQNYYINKNEIYPNHHDLLWQQVNKDNIGELSAVAYYFADSLNVDIPIGIISNNKGGTSASCWLSFNDLKQNQCLKETYYDAYYQDIRYIPLSVQKENYQQYDKKLMKYQEEFNNYKHQNPSLTTEDIKQIIGHTPWPPPKSYLDFKRPCGLYKTMFLRTIHYPICAILWYQGEEDVEHYDCYYQLLTLLIKNWRDVYKECIPFYILQLPEYHSPIHYGFSYIRLIQSHIAFVVKNVHLVVLLGTGNPYNIHPENKKEVGYRLAQSVMKYRYDKCSYTSPQLLEYQILDDHIEIIFDQPLKKCQVHLKPIDGYTIDNKLIIVSKTLKKVIYAHENVPKIELMSLHDMPVSPFILNIHEKE